MCQNQFRPDRSTALIRVVLKLAEAIPVSAGTLADWARRGWLHSRRTPAQHLWILWADKQEVKRLRKLASFSHRGVVEYPAELTTPKSRIHGGGGKPCPKPRGTRVGTR